MSNKIYLLLLFLFEFSLLECSDENSCLAVTVVPIADAFSKSSQSSKKMCLAPEAGRDSCPRSYQLLFNEKVRIIKKVGSEFKFESFTTFHEGEPGSKQRVFWTHQDNLKKLTDLEVEGIDLSLFPMAYDGKGLGNVLTLISPWHDFVTGKTYSAGTRFVRDNNSDSAEAYGIFVLDFKNFKKLKSSVPKKLSLIRYPKSKIERIKLFVSILKKWANQEEFIPYVWGGISFIKTCKKNDFFKQNQEDETVAWARPDSDVPASGIDCSSLILRVAQMSGIPYFLKNSVTIYNNLIPIANKCDTEDGDIIWYKGHVIVVSDVKNNKVIESVGYPLGFGKVHEIDLAKTFKGINSFSDLEDAYFNKKPIRRIDVNGKPKRVLDKFLILKLDSVWK